MASVLRENRMCGPPQLRRSSNLENAIPCDFAWNSNNPRETAISSEVSGEVWEGARGYAGLRTTLENRLGTDCALRRRKPILFGPAPYPRSVCLLCSV